MSTYTEPDHIAELRSRIEQLETALSDVYDWLDDIYDVDEPEPGHHREYPSGAGKILELLRKVR